MPPSVREGSRDLVKLANDCDLISARQYHVAQGKGALAFEITYMFNHSGFEQSVDVILPRHESLHSTNKRRHFQYAVRRAGILRPGWVWLAVHCCFSLTEGVCS